jgi:hypothetical protein
MTNDWSALVSPQHGDDCVSKFSVKKAREHLVKRLHSDSVGENLVI